MRIPFRTRYLTLQEEFTPQVQAAWESILAAALIPVLPDPAFVAKLGYDLVEEAASRWKARQRRRQVWLAVGWVGGSILTVVGGLVGLHFWQRRSAQSIMETQTAEIPTSAVLSAS
ncbi:MAG: hypothetical protein J7M17_05860 [Anaerolineae bacterium]|nr:hypothetical protein [Anaerolineae bacterium]